MSKPRCDPIDTSGTLSALAARGVGLTGASRDPAVLRQWYADYASVAARPYARASWEKVLRAAQKEPALSPSQGSHRKAGKGSRANGPDAIRGERINFASPVKPANILTLLSDAPMLYVKGDCLTCRDDNLILRYERRSHKPYAIVLIGWGGRITIGAIRFCADHDIALIILDWGRDLMSVALTHAERAERIIRAQVGADRLGVSKSIISAKIKAHFDVGAIDEASASRWLARTKNAPDVAALTMTEALAANQAWAGREVILRWREAGYVPPTWKHPWNIRRSLGRRTARGSAYKAKDPINALLNLALAVTAGRLTATLAAYGLSPAIGFLHKTPRWPLTYDTIEPLRPYVENNVFDFIDATAFAPRDFLTEHGSGIVKTNAPMHKSFVDATALGQSEIDRGVGFIAGLLGL
jgi:CRISPR/Cas system-associated endonuclease Cas1